MSVVALLLTAFVSVADAQPVSPATDARNILVQARSAASSITQAHTRARALRAIAWAQHRAGDRAAALQTLEQATGAALLIEDQNWRVDAVADVLFIQIHVGDVAGARRRTSTLFVGLVSPLPWLLVEAGQPAAARALMNSLEPQRRPELLAAIAVAQGAAGNRRASAATLQEAAALATALTQDWRRSYALVAVIRASAELRDVAGARRLAQQVSDRGSQAAAWEQVAVAQARSGDVAGARQTVGAIADTERRNLALIGIGRAQAKAGDVQGTLGTAALAWGHARARILREAAKAQAAAGDVVRARATASVIFEEGESSAALRAIARAQLRRGDVKDAQATVALLPPIAQTYVLGEVAVAQVKAGDVAGGLATARGATTTDYGWLALRDVAIAQAAAGDLVAARQTAASIGDAYTEYRDTAEALCGISAVQAKRGDVKGAVAAALAQTAAAPKAFGLLGAAQGLLDGAGLGGAEPVRRGWDHDRDDGVDD